MANLDQPHELHDLRQDLDDLHQPLEVISDHIKNLVEKMMGMQGRVLYGKREEIYLLA